MTLFIHIYCTHHSVALMSFSTFKRLTHVYIVKSVCELRAYSVQIPSLLLPQIVIN